MRLSNITERLYVSIPAWLKGELRREAKRENVPMATLVREILAREMGRRNRQLAWIRYVTGADDALLKVRVYCGCFTGPCRWHGTEIYESDECVWEDTVAVDGNEWEEGCVSVTCPLCGAKLHQGDGHFELGETEDPERKTA